jgi:D-alanyl-D-alanine carboxypeptidase/D-alanyl-D-alanine-endopeptidase (penicillin-binding protein 4)
MKGETGGARRLATVVAALVVTAGCTRSAGPAEPVPMGPVPVLRMELSEIFSDPAFGNAHWGVMVQSLENGEIVYRQNADKLFMPASNNKLITAAVSLARLGADHRFQTRIAATGPVSEGGVLEGDLVVIGGGDPAISERFYDDDPTAAFRDWADSLKARGVRRISGDVIGDDDLFDDVHVGPGWSWDYLDSYYAAEIGSLLYNEGAVTYRIAPGDSVGEPAKIDSLPRTGYLKLDVDVTTVADSLGVFVRSDRSPFSNDARLWGEIWVNGDTVTRYLAPHDPTLLFVTVLGEVLEAEGIEVEGGPADMDDRAERPEAEDLATLFIHESPTLAEIVRPFLKRSQNQIGEMLMRYLGATTSGTGSIRAGRDAVEATLTGWGLTPKSYIYADGSGLSRYNYVSPDALVRLLRVMARRPEFDVFYESLPIAGVDGTLRNRMRGTRAEGNARAKTGSISNSRALSGYVTTLDGEMLIFAMIANNFDVSSRAAEYVQDLAIERLANFSRR